MDPSLKPATALSPSPAPSGAAATSAADGGIYAFTFFAILALSGLTAFCGYKIRRRSWGFGWVGLHSQQAASPLVSVFGSRSRRSVLVLAVFRVMVALWFLAILLYRIGVASLGIYIAYTVQVRSVLGVLG